jgi:acyl carrier protein
MSLRDDLVIESMSLLSLTVRLGEELGVDVTEMDLQLDSLRSVADLIRMARVLSKSRPISKLGN